MALIELNGLSKEKGKAEVKGGHVGEDLKGELEVGNGGVGHFIFHYIHLWHSQE